MWSWRRKVSAISSGWWVSLSPCSRSWAWSSALDCDLTIDEEGERLLILKSKFNFDLHYSRTPPPVSRRARRDPPVENSAANANVFRLALVSCELRHSLAACSLPNSSVPRSIQ